LIPSAAPASFYEQMFAFEASPSRVKEPARWTST
jgi:hypothetical protein